MEQKQKITFHGKAKVRILKIDKEKNIRLSYRNPDILRLYSNYLKYPDSQIAKTLLHTTFKPNDTYFKKGIVKKETYINNENVPR